MPSDNPIKIWTMQYRFGFSAWGNWVLSVCIVTVLVREKHINKTLAGVAVSNFLTTENSGYLKIPKLQFHRKSEDKLGFIKDRTQEWPEFTTA